MTSSAWAGRLIVLILLALTTSSIFNSTVAASRVNSHLNMIKNPSFEQGLQDWGTAFFDGPPGSTISSNDTRAVSGDYSARIDVSTGLVFGSVDLFQYLPSNTSFVNISQTPHGLSFWFFIEPKFTNFTLLLVKVKAASTIEMNYVFPNPSLRIDFSNTTDGGEAGRAVKFIVMPAPVLDQWNHFSTNLVHDWQAPLMITNSTGTFELPGFGLNDTLFRIQFEAFVYQNPITGMTYSETIWIDDVALLRGDLRP